MGNFFLLLSLWRKNQDAVVEEKNQEPRCQDPKKNTKENQATKKEYKKMLNLKAP
jgi:hypothetical protein